MNSVQQHIPGGSGQPNRKLRITHLPAASHSFEQVLGSSQLSTPPDPPFFGQFFGLLRRFRSSNDSSADSPPAAFTLSSKSSSAFVTAASNTKPTVGNK